MIFACSAGSRQVNLPYLAGRYLHFALGHQATIIRGNCRGCEELTSGEIMATIRDVRQPQHLATAMVEDDRLRSEAEICELDVDDRWSLRRHRLGAEQNQRKK